MIHRTLRLVTLLALSVIVASPLPAQTFDSLTAGTRLRIARHAPPRLVIGTLLSADSTSLIVRPDRGPSPMTLPVQELKQVDISIGGRTRGEGFARGAIIGAVVGTGVGVIATALAIRHDRRTETSDYIPNSAIVGAISVAGTAASTIAGGLIGVATREKWRRVWPPR